MEQSVEFNHAAYPAVPGAIDLATQFLELLDFTLLPAREGQKGKFGEVRFFTLGPVTIELSDLTTLSSETELAKGFHLAVKVADLDWWDWKFQQFSAQFHTPMRVRYDENNTPFYRFPDVLRFEIALLPIKSN